MMRKIPLVLASAFCACSLQACFVDSNHRECRTEYNCTTQCTVHTQTHTDGFWIWDDNVEICEDVCYPYDYCTSVDQCYYDRDCGAYGVCRNGVCYDGNVGRTGFAGLCDSCNNSYDCRDQGALCMELVSGEKVCGRSCVVNTDCPSGYDCRDLQGMSARQCVPSYDSCRADYCRNDFDCVENASCQNNRCVFGYNNSNNPLNECEVSSDCRNYRSASGDELSVCVSYRQNNDRVNRYCTLPCYSDIGCDPGYYCHLTQNNLESGLCYRGNEHFCMNDRDCASVDPSMVCSNGKCAVSCRRDSDCQSPSGAFYCNNGACRFDDSYAYGY